MTRSPSHESAELAAVQRWLSELTGRHEPLELLPLAGGASPRRFLRARLPDGTRAVVMQVPEHTPDVAFARSRARRWPFLEVRSLLENASVRVPRLFAEACERGLLLVEDLGETLAERLARTPHQREALYRRAVGDLAVAQRRLVDLPHDSVVRERAFDSALLSSELDHFWEWAIAARGGDTSSARQSDFRAARDAIVRAIGELPRGFVHRDYQSRNLMVTGNPDDELELAWIDFQDALLGPRAYDLVALLCDSYQPFERAFVDRRLDDFAQSAELSSSARSELGYEFDLITLQRKLKDAGRFVFIDRTRNDPSFLPFIRPTLAIVRQALARTRNLPALAPIGVLEGLLTEAERLDAER